jgi:DNA invertase Pin-like site-specific DNA recombinase
VSTKEQVDEGNSLASQEKECRSYAFKEGYEVVEIFIEQGESAKTQNRTELRKLLDYCAERKNKINVVIIYKIDRISRNMDDYSQIRILLKRHNVEIKSTSESFENSPAGRFMENMIANVAQFDNDVRTERSIGGMREATKEGRYVWMAPIGYNNVRRGGRATIAPNEKLGPLINKTFELVSRSIQSLEETRKQMTKEGLVNRVGKPLAKSYFYHLLRNELYTGWIIKFGERHRGTFDALVSEETFTQVQRVLRHKNSNKMVQHIPDRPEFPLRRFVIDEYGKKLTGSWSKGRSKKYPFYRFGGNGTNYNRDNFEKTFIDFMNTYALNKTLFSKLKKYIIQSLVRNNKNELEESALLRKGIQELSERQSKLIDQNHRGVISDDALRIQSAIIDKELFNIHSALANISYDETNYEEVIDEVEEYLKNPGITWANAPLEGKLQLQWFQFPSGCTLINNFFGTTEISSFFKVKKLISSYNPSRVPSRVKNWNHKVVNNSSDIDNTTYWKQFGKDMIRLSNILKKIKEIKPNLKGYNNPSSAKDRYSSEVRIR